MFSPSRNPPLLTLAIISLLWVLQLLSDAVFDVLVFDRWGILSGEVWRALSGHLVHTDWSHLLWNVLAFAVLGCWLEYHSRRLLLAVTFAGMLVIDLLLLSPWASIDYYCGLSGVLNSLMMVGFYLYWRRFPTILTLVGFAGYLLKNIWEAMLGQSILTSPAWNAYVPAHFAGALAGVLVLMAVWFLVVRRSVDRLENSSPTRPGVGHVEIVAS